MSGDGISNLANVLNNRMKEVGKMDALADFGTVGKNGFVTTDILQMPLGRSDYMVLQHVGSLAEGDRVLVVWVYPEPVVVGKVTRG